MAQLTWNEVDDAHWVSVPGLYRLELNAAKGNVFIYRVTHSRNWERGEGHYDALLNARYNLEDAQRYAQDHHDGRPEPAAEPELELIRDLRKESQ
jgi:hypothetical protein